MHRGTVLPIIAFFAAAPIPPHTHLTFDYGNPSLEEKVGRHKEEPGSSKRQRVESGTPGGLKLMEEESKPEEGRKRCCCGAPECRKFLPLDLSADGTE